VSIARMGETQAKEGQNEALRDFLLSIIPLILASQGCLSCELFQSQEDPAKFVMVEVWESVAAHQTSVKNIPPEKIREIMPLLAGSPGGRYYDTIAREGGSGGN
jgi:heme oxygenase (mycobilin-producing)